jgi:hypothetical protein
VARHPHLPILLIAREDLLTQGVGACANVELTSPHYIISKPERNTMRLAQLLIGFLLMTAIGVFFLPPLFINLTCEVGVRCGNGFARMTPASKQKGDTFEEQVEMNRGHMVDPNPIQK